MIFFTAVRFSNLIRSMEIKRFAYYNFLSISYTGENKVQPHYQRTVLLPLNMAFAATHFHTSCRNCEIFNIQDEEDFKTRVIKSKKATIVDFHAKWCGPCKVLMPRLESAVAATKEAIHLAKVDIDDLPDLAMEYNVGAVPSVMAVKNGEVIDKFVGLKDDDQIESFIASVIKK